MALGFAALARRPGSERSLLQELQSPWRRSRVGAAGRRLTGSGSHLRELGRANRDSKGYLMR